MKQILILSLLFISFKPTFSQSQNEYIVYKTVPLIEERVITLHSTTKSFGTGNERNSNSIISFDIPRSTARWYYSFTTLKTGTTLVENLKLATQVAKMLPLPGQYKAGVLALDQILSEIKVPDGTREVNTFLMADEQNAYNFLNSGKGDYTVGSEMLNTKSGKKGMKRLQAGRYYLGIQNLSSLYKVDVKIEAVAIVIDVNATKKNIEAANKTEDNASSNDASTNSNNSEKNPEVSEEKTFYVKNITDTAILFQYSANNKTWKDETVQPGELKRIKYATTKIYIKYVTPKDEIKESSLPPDQIYYFKRFMQTILFSYYKD